MSPNLGSLTVSSNDGIINMVRILANQIEGVKICHLNAQSLNNKIDEFRLVFENSSMDVICVSETWLKKGTPDSMVNLSGYRLYRADRNHRTKKTRAGGVAIYIKVSIKSNLVVQFGDGEEIEYLFVNLLTEGKKLMVGCVYRYNKHVDYSTFFEMIEKLTTSCTDLVIAGDFNSNLFETTELSDSMLQIGLTSVNCNFPTHFTNTASTLLDLFFVNDVSKVLLYDQQSSSCFSRHDLICITYDFHLKHNVETFSYRDFKNINYQFLTEIFYNIDWDSIFYIPSVNDQLCFLETNLLHIYDLVVPIKTRITKNTTRPWFTMSIKLLIEKRDRAYSRWKRFKTPELKEEFRRNRLEVNRLIRKAKSEYYARRFSNAVDGKSKWKTIREIGIGKIKNNNIISKYSADELNDVFTRIPIPTLGQHNYDFDNNLNRSDIFEFRCVNETEVSLNISSIKSNAIGYDNISPKFLKILLPQLLPYITHIFNTILMTSVFPTNWKHAKIIPVSKSNSEFRPIAILPFLSKVLEKILHKQISDHLAQYNLLTSRQSGFRQKHSCITALIDVTEEIRCSIDGGNLTLLVLLDHSKAFDSVDHSLLCSKLYHQFSFSDTSVSLIKSYLEQRSQSVFLNDTYSGALSVTRGVPQGSILGPLLFSLYVNDLPNNVSYSKIHLYADDVQLYINTSLKTINENVCKLNSDLDSIYCWASQNGLCLNPQKSKCLIIRKKSLKQNINVDIRINNEKIEIVTSAKNLGITFNSTLSWDNHVNIVVGKTYSMLRTLWATHFCTPVNIRMLIAKTYLMPVLLYGCEVYANCDSTSKRKLNTLFNNIARYVLGLHTLDGIATLSKKLYNLTFNNLVNIRTLMLLHKIVYTKVPSYLYNRITFARSNRGNKVIPIAHRSKITEWQFYYNAIHLWNRLPNKAQTNSNVNTFKTEITKHLNNYVT